MAEDDVEHLAEVLTDAYLKGVRAGSFTLARLILAAGYRRHIEPKRCEDCGRTARELQPVLDPARKVVGWVGPTCKRRRDEAAQRGAGVQLPLANGADR